MLQVETLLVQNFFFSCTWPHTRKAWMFVLNRAQEPWGVEHRERQACTTSQGILLSPHREHLLGGGGEDHAQENSTAKVLLSALERHGATGELHPTCP